MRPTTKKLLALSAAVSLGLAACGDDEVAQPAVSGEPAPVEEQTTTTAEAEAAVADEGEEASADDPAATLRAQLTGLLQEHVYLAGMAIEATLTDGEDDPAAQAAVQALDDNSVAISEVVGEIPGVDDTEDFLDLWRDHIGYFVDYAAATAEGDDDAAAEALDGLEEYQQSAADLLDAVTDGELPADDVFGELETHVTMVTDAIDAVAEDDPEALTLLRDAARHMDEVAAALAGGVVAAHPDAIDGDPESPPARTRAQLTGGMAEHTYLTLFAVQRAADAGSTTDPAVQAAVTLVEGTADSLANVVGGASGTDARDAFAELWRDHVVALLDRASAQVDDDPEAAAAAGSELALFRDAAVALFDTVTGEAASAGDIGSDIDTYLDRMYAAIDAVVAGDPTAYDDARAAAQHATDMAARWASGIVAASAERDATERLPDDGSGTDTAVDREGTGTDAGSVDGQGIGRGDTETGSAGAEPETDAEPAQDPSENPAPDAEGGR